MTLHPGDVFKRSKFFDSQQRIYNLQIFEDVTPKFESVGDEGDIDITINVKEKQSGILNMGFGYSNVQKLTGFLQVSEKNFLGRSLEWNASVEFGKLTKNFYISIFDPWFLDTQTGLGFSLFDTERDWFGYRVHNQGTSIRVGRPFFNLDYSKYYLEYRLEKVNYSDFSRELDPKDPFDPRNQAKKYPKITSNFSLTFLRDSRDNYLFPSSGSETKIITSLVGGPLGGSEDIGYYSIIADAKWYIKFIYKLTFYTNLRIGFVNNLGKDKTIDPRDLFRLGGSFTNSIRGYPDFSITPEGSVFGGRSMFITSFGFLFPIIEQIGGNIFFDAGNTWANPYELNVFNLKRGLGFGIMLQTPMGPLGFDYAYGFDKQPPGWEPHFRFGGYF